MSCSLSSTPCWSRKTWRNFLAVTTKSSWSWQRFSSEKTLDGRRDTPTACRDLEQTIMPAALDVEIFIHHKDGSPWFNAPSLTSAAENGLNLYKSLQKFKNVHKKVSSSTSTVLTPGGTEICKPTLPTISLKSELADFVGERSTTLFDLLNTPVDFLLKPDWQLQPEYHSVKTSLKNLLPSTTHVNELWDW